jgi:hypothetical protein
MKLYTTAIGISLLLFSSISVYASNFVIDGDLSDWGVQRTGQVSDWTPNAGIYYTIEDQNTSYLEPGWGGQAYDAEALYVYLSDTHLYIAMATGHDPNRTDNPERDTYGAGDFAIDFGKDGSYEAGINIKPAWDTFGVNGGFYSGSNLNWGYGLFEDGATQGYVKSEHPTSILDGTLLGQAVLAINSTPQNGFGQWQADNHYFYEMSLSRQLLQAAGWQGESFNVQWTMNCANDSIITDPPATVPEPSSLLLSIFGFVGLTRAWRPLNFEQRVKQLKA